MSTVALEHVYKRYGELEAVKDVSFECGRGEFLVLLGPSGAGKTSTLKMISGLERISAGKVYIDGVVVNDLEPRQRRVSMVFENYALYPHLTAFENIASPLRAAGVPPADLDARVRETARTLMIDALLDRRPAHLSGGQQQRVAFGRSLVKQADVYLMDEPLSHLDAKLRHQMRGELKRIHADVGATTIYVTHDFSEAIALADRIVVINKGVIQQIGTPEDIYERPANVFVADLVGEPAMNLVACTLARDPSRPVLKCREFEVAVPEHLAAGVGGLPAGHPVTLGFRPTNVTVHRGPVDIPAVRGEVYVFEPLGGRGVLSVKVGDHVLKVKVREAFTAEIGESVWLELRPSRMHLFDGATGARLQ